ncbi:MAG: FlgO family outer membrane protein, partial [Acidiferrobacterales bacterium]|nr:FlgO family outer membrane protein [Acidiferrobacterales bacterium]
MQRRLVAILAADVVGYTRLMGVDEAGTLRRLTELRQDFLEPLINAHHGRIVKLMGDGLLVEFASVVDAVACALAWQGGVTNRNKDLRFRIGINLGDVIVEGGDIHGDGVNVAARLEGMAEPGGICLSGDAYRQARGKVEAEFEDLGEQSLKNVAEPVRVYRVAASNSNTMPTKDEAEPLPLPDKPSIAVLPFANMSTDPEQEFFSDGITEDIITALSKIQNLLVVARNSILIYKAKAVDVRQVSREQGVRYVLEGSVRKSGNRVRINAQLINAKSSHHIWAERFDRDLDDIFAVQDEITREVVIALDVRLRHGEQARFWSSGTENLEAWESVRLAMDWLGHATPESPNNARELCKKALDLDPNYAMAWVTLGWVYHHGVDVGLGYTSVRDREGGLESALNCGKRALELDPSCADAFSLLSMCHLSSGEYDQAITMS